MRSKRINVCGPVVFEDLASGAQGTCSVDHIINYNALLALDVSDKDDLADLIGSLALLADRGETDSRMAMPEEVLMEGGCPFDAACVGTHDYQVVFVLDLPQKVAQPGESRLEILKLTLRRHHPSRLQTVQIHRYDPTCSDELHYLCDIPRCDRSCFALTPSVLPCISIVWCNDGDRLGS